MKHILFFLTGVCMCLFAYAQKDKPVFGKIDKSDLELSNCPFEASADAMVLSDVGETFCFLNLNSVSAPLSSQYERHVRIKIFNLKGIDQANIKIKFASEQQMEEIKNLSAQTINLDVSGNQVVSKVDKNSIYTRKINKKYSEVAFAFPDVKPGSIIEYKYKVESQYLYAVKTWFFQRQIPVRFSSYTLDFPIELSISAVPQGALNVKMKESYQANRVLKIFSMNDVPGIREEPFTSCGNDYLEHLDPYLVSLQLPQQLPLDLVKTWPKLVMELMDDEDFGIQLKKNIPRTSDLEAMLVGINDPYKKMVIIENYVSKNMQWNEMDGIWALEGVKSAWKNKKGTTGEINLILVNLLKDMGIDAGPILVSTKNNGRINISIANYNQFDKVMAYVSINDQHYVLDATDLYKPPELLPLDVLYSEGLLIKKYSTYDWGWKELVDDKHRFENITTIDAEIDKNGMIKGNATVSSVDYAKMQRLPVYKKNKEAYIKSYLASDENSLKIDSIIIENEDNDSLPLIHNCIFSMPVNKSGDYHSFNANLLSGLNKNPFIADTRNTDVFFGANQFYQIDASFSLPEGYSFEAPPRNIRMRLPDTSVTFYRSAYVSGKKLHVKMEIEFKKPVFSIDEYAGLHEFYKKLFGFLNEQFVFKKE